MYSSHGPCAWSSQPGYVKMAPLVPVNVYEWFIASSVPNSSAVPLMSCLMISHVIKQGGEGQSYSDGNDGAVGDLKAPF